MAAELPHLKIEIEATGGDNFLVTIRTRGKSRPFVLPVLGDHLRKARECLEVKLGEFKVEIGGELQVSDLNRQREAMAILGKLSEDVAWLLVGQSPERLTTLEESLRGAFRGIDSAAATAAFTEISADSRMTFPFELLRWRYFDPAKIKDISDLTRACNSFVGFVSVVRRSILPADFTDVATIPQDTSMDNEGGLRIKLFHFPGLSGAQAERDFFERQDQAVLAVDGPWPSRPTTPQEAGDICATTIFDPRQTFAGKRGRPDLVQHFACHCEAAGPKSRLRFGWSDASGDGKVHVYLSSIDTGLKNLTNRRRWPSGRLKPRNWQLPLIFLNACSSSVLSTSDAASFAELFLRQGNRAFIGTETKVPDSAAAQLSAYFYENLLGGATVGVSLARAKYELLENFGNPLGLLYTLYGNPDLQVKFQVPRTSIK